jgi:very-short-patch-repair endonuclease
VNVDLKLRALAERQHGVITRKQAQELGATRQHLRRRLESRDWEPVTSKVIRLVGTRRTFRQRAMAAALDAGPDSAVSHESAAALWRLPGFLPGPLHVTQAVGRSGRASTLATLHRTCRLPEDHVSTVDGIPVTSPSRTVFDLAGVLHPGRTERALDNALARRLTTMATLRTVTASLAAAGRGGSALMRRLLDARADGYVAPESGLEARFLSIVRAAGLPEPLRQRDLGGQGWVGRVDFVYPDKRLVVEIDSGLHHSTLLDETADAKRDGALREAGYRVVRVGEQEVWHRPQEVVRRLLAS